MDYAYSGVLTRPDTNFQALRDGRRSPILHFDVDLTTARSVTAGTALRLDIASEMFLADVDPVNQGDAVVHFQDQRFDNASAPIYVTRGFKTAAPFTQLMVENAAQPGKRLRFFYGVGVDAEPGGNNVTVSGSVSVIDGGRYRTMADLAYSGYALQTAAAAVNAGIQLSSEDPNKRIILSQIIPSSGNTAASGFAVAVGVATGTLVGAALNKRLGGPASTAGVMRKLSAVASGAPFVTLPKGTPYKLAEPIVLASGTTLTVWNNTVNEDCNCSFEFVEEAA